MSILHPIQYRIFRFTFIPFIFFLVSCTSSLSPATPTLLPSPVIPTFPPTLTSTPIPPTATPAPAPERASYVLNTSIDYDAHFITVDETIVYPNHTGQPLNALVLAVEPNLWVNSFTLTGILIDNTPTTNFTLKGQRLDLPLPASLAPESVTTINIQYTIVLPFAEQEDPNISRPRIFGYTSRQLNLTQWYPFVVPFINGDFVLHDPWYYGEHLVYDTADFEVNVKFTNSTNPPIVASSGFAEPQADFTRYTLVSGRTFVLSASRDFLVSTTQVEDVTLSSYYFALNDGAGQAALQASAEALQVYSQRYGPYAHKTLAIVMGDFNDGMEYSAFYYLSRDFYNLYDRTPKNYLTFVSVHETSHQWWFEQVANDQALQPWLDEALATYSERIYYETYHPELVSWWWDYRINFFEPEGFVDIPIYEGKGFRTYTNAVYFRGAYFLEELRTRIGDEAFFSFIQDYFNQQKGKIATANDFFNILKTHTTVDYSDIVRKYFFNVYE